MKSISLITIIKVLSKNVIPLKNINTIVITIARFLYHKIVVLDNISNDLFSKFMLSIASS
ncbi:hypothetical protein AYO25_04365 [Candidatus Liberibacter solanacearum]|uniref:Uncharacterized protein n=1 Tax=Candidatus Liberibacter solanacearum TaxID=556287 RepID=A0A1V2N7C6_9HYPH|nr:hypothetical protein AYO25_04365 [Candidatus Liberibacter solanacearum]ONI59452.1 hypothetical protein AYJ09_03790 [Candidatus Liberibacter solanacearum]